MASESGPRHDAAAASASIISARTLVRMSDAATLRLVGRVFAPELERLRRALPASEQVAAIIPPTAASAAAPVAVSAGDADPHVCPGEAPCRNEAPPARMLPPPPPRERAPISPSRLLFGADYDEVNRTLTAVLALKWVLAGDYDAFVRGQAGGAALRRRSFELLRELLRQTLRCGSFGSKGAHDGGGQEDVDDEDDDVFTLVLAIVVNDLGKDPCLAEDVAAAEASLRTVESGSSISGIRLTAQMTPLLASQASPQNGGASVNDLDSDDVIGDPRRSCSGGVGVTANHDAVVHRAAAAGLITCLRALECSNPSAAAAIGLGLRVGARFNMAQLLQGECVPGSLLKLSLFQGHERAFGLRFLDQLFDVAGASGHCIPGARSEDHLLHSENYSERDCDNTAAVSVRRAAIDAESAHDNAGPPIARAALALTEPVFCAFYAARSVLADVIDGRLSCRAGYDRVLLQRARIICGGRPDQNHDDNGFGIDIRHREGGQGTRDARCACQLSVAVPEQRALLRLLAMGRVDCRAQAARFAAAFGALPDSVRRRLVAGLNVDGLHHDDDDDGGAGDSNAYGGNSKASDAVRADSGSGGSGQAVVPYYMPALFSQALRHTTRLSRKVHDVNLGMEAAESLQTASGRTTKEAMVCSSAHAQQVAVLKSLMAFLARVLDRGLAQSGGSNDDDLVIERDVKFALATINSQEFCDNPDILESLRVTF